ncbi:hypothetical protein CDD80_5646 [Ophiocordyceps camponoti-rufipedis]|uniref:LysM domain-containing protein n=1 Tax=Ophiocordyceps camponoti-rufipedis TaxID=2004952 RepID=A0A2C5ZDI8_9HYPO|nr:hypothetical protein CDD80_5646 [Ophiocordyceps camponoti-rufipedis]
MESCCTCATLLPSKASISATRLPCCARIVCAPCLQTNRRFATCCPYCQVSTAPSPLPQGLRDPPAYRSVASTRASTASAVPPPPPYSPSPAAKARDKEASDIIHFLDHDHDTVSSLSLRYRVPASVLRRANNITSDQLLLGRKTILIPAQYCANGVSLSPCPVLGEEEELRKSKIRRFMIACKVADYDVALLYLEQSDYHLRAAVDSYFDDESWERKHPRPQSGDNAKVGRRQKGRLRPWLGL